MSLKEKMLGNIILKLKILLKTDGNILKIEVNLKQY